MYKAASLVVAALLASWPMTDVQAAAAQDAEIRDIDAQFRRAMIQGDAAQLTRIVAADAKIIHGDHGSVEDKQALIGKFRSWHIDTYERTPVLLKVDRDLAVLVSITRKIAQGQETDTSTTEVFIRRAGRWQILVLQNTDHSAG